MTVNKEKTNKLFPLSAKYDEKWIRENSYDGLTLYCLESLCAIMDFKDRMRVLDLGCGRAISSIFLAKEFDLQVWALDKNTDPSKNYKRIIEAGCEEKVFPIKADAGDMPFAQNFFDAVVSVDAYSYFGMSERYPAYLMSFLKSGGEIGIFDGCFRKEFNSPQEVPEHIIPIYYDHEDPWYPVHSVNWWKNFWIKSGKSENLIAQIVPQTDIIWKKYIQNCGGIESEKKLVRAIENDRGDNMAFFRMKIVKK